ncbi:WYL domain-containing protein [Citricoccus sp. NPDC055426]|uniref:helix-turn-helix transcriptional regulator n=1 Tax=Citricoccus sp. NPDC055426 TaxID=3155536 RepID=UPI0034223ED9
MRTTRLLAIMMELSRTQRSTVGQLAERHGVSTRTIQRDLAALHGIGVPVWTRTGPAGGVGLVEGWSSPVTGMTASELRALVIGEAGARELGLQEDFTTARLKILGTRTARDPGVGSASERFLIDHERWFSTPARPAALPVVSRAVWSGRRLTIAYETGAGSPRAAEPPADPPRSPAAPSRLVDPLGLVLKTDVWYLVAAHRRRVRTYRLSRIVSAEIHGDEAWRPEPFSLADYWERSRAAFETSLQSLPVRLSIPAAAVGALQDAVPGAGTRSALAEARRQDHQQGHQQDDQQDHRLEIGLLMENEDIALGQLMPIPGLEVHEPAGLRRRLWESGREIASRHGSF